MNIVVEKQPKCVATLRVEIPAEKVSGQRAEILRGYASKARVPGFRPGKAPASVVEKRFQKEITEELNGSLFNEAFDEALKQESLKVIDFGVPENVTTTPEGGLSFSSKLTLAPEVQLPDYKGITVTVPPAALPDEEVNKQLTALQERFADFKDIEGRAAAAGDFAIIDYTSTVEGKPTEEFLGKSAGYIAGREGFWVRLDEQAFLPGFALQLEGLNVGDSKEISIVLPEDFALSGIAGKEIVFATTLKELKEAVLPELNDELAAKLLPGKTIEDIKTIIRDNMGQERQRKIDDQKVNQIVEYFKPTVRPKWMTAEAYAQLPGSIRVRELRYRVTQRHAALQTDHDLLARLHCAVGDAGLVGRHPTQVIRQCTDRRDHLQGVAVGLHNHRIGVRLQQGVECPQMGG